MKTAKAAPRFSLSKAALACLAWGLLSGVLRGGETTGPLCDEAASDEILQDVDLLGAPPSRQCSPVQCIAVAPSDDQNGAGGPWPQPTRFSNCDGSDEERPPNPIWKWVPMGMVPYIGPRTPDELKDRGIGIPLLGKGWRSQPFAISTFAGVTDGGPLIRDHVNQAASFYGGFNFGWDYDHYWGIEKRLGFGALNLTNGDHQPIANTGFSVTGEYRLMYYPLGDTRWRPFITAGVGWSDFYYDDDHGASHLNTVGMIPVGIGLKYLCSEHTALRMDLIDEVTIGDGPLSNFQYVAFTIGFEYRYGQKLLHLPWHGKSG